MATKKKVSEKKTDKNEVDVVTEAPAKKMTKHQQKLNDYYQTVFEQSEELDVKPVKVVVCAVCGKNRYAQDYYRSYSIGHMCTINDIGERHSMICRTCSKKIFQKCMTEALGDYYTAFAHWCQIMDIYFDKECVDDALSANTEKLTYDLISLYMNKLSMKRIIGVSFWNSPMLANNLNEYLIEADSDYYEKIKDENKIIKEYPVEFEDWKQEDLDNYDQVLEWYKYDPFKDEPLEDRRKLYYNLIGFSDPEISDDVGKANACIDMCRSLQRIEKLNKRRILLESEDDFDVKEVAALASLQKQERESVQKYQKEWGFNARYSLNKQQGAGTLTGILKEMDDKMFEDSLPNAYDIKTSDAMVMAAEASWRGIFSQLNISESEFSEIVKNQREEIMKLRRELDDTKEKLRLTNIEIKRSELQAKLDKQGGDV